jgi:hypothetical protein
MKLPYESDFQMLRNDSADETVRIAMRPSNALPQPRLIFVEKNGAMSVSRPKDVSLTKPPHRPEMISKADEGRRNPPDRR